MLGLSCYGLRLRPLVRAAPPAHAWIPEHLFQDKRLRPRVLSRGRGGAAGGPRSVLDPPITRGRDGFRVEVIRIRAAQLSQDGPLCCGRVLELVHHHVGEARRQLGAELGLLVEELAEQEEDVAAIEVAGLGEDAVVGGAELGEVGFGRVRAGLHLIHLLQKSREQARRVAADVVIAQRQVVDPVEQDGEPLGRAEDVEERVEAGGDRVAAEQPLADFVPGSDPELCPTAAEQVLDASAQITRGGPVGGEDENAVRLGAAPDQEGEATGERLCLARAGGSDEKQRPISMSDGALLSFCKGEHGPTLAGGEPP